jgi:hypothetical protein
MRLLAIVLLAHVLGYGVLFAQANPPPGSVLVDDVPEGTNWVANASTRMYYRVGCPITIRIPAADRLYYKNESSLQAAAFKKSDQCDLTGANAEAVSPSRSSPAPASEMPPPPVSTKQPREVKNPRKGFWFNAGLGYGTLGCEGCDDRQGSVSGGLALGGTINQHVMLGGGTNGWSKSENGRTLTVGTVAAVIRFYPSATGAFFLLGGLGVGTVHVEVDGVGSDDETGFGGLLGVGYDIRIGKNVSLTPFWNGLGITTSDSDVNVGQIGLGITTH